MMKIAIVSSESVPFSKSGGLGDVVYALFKELSYNQEIEVRLYLPALKTNISDTDTVYKKLSVYQNGNKAELCLYKKAVPSIDAPVFLIGDSGVITRNSIYGEKNAPYKDNCLRFSVFCKSVLSAMEIDNWKPDVIHCNDWPTGIIPAWMKKRPFFKKTASLFSLHNLGYQGEFPLRTIHYTGLRIGDFSDDNTKKTINFLESGIRNSVRINTVSPTYAQEIQQPGNGFGLETLLAQKSSILSGIVNGIDEDEWNPQKDPHLDAPFSAQDRTGKQINKLAILKELGLQEDPNKPLFALISRFANQKGIEPLFGGLESAMDKIVEGLPIQFAVIGTGEKWCEQKVAELSKKYTNFKAITTFDNRLTHRLEAGADFFLMPSVYEPCGLNQMYSSRYGTIPIVRKTGGLADTVISPDNDNPGATGLIFNDLTPESIYATVAWATNLYLNRKDLIEKMIANGMQKDFSWGKSAEKYVELYRQIVKS